MRPVIKEEDAPMIHHGAGAKRRRLPAATPAEEDGAVRDSGRTVMSGDAADHRAD